MTWQYLKVVSVRRKRNFAFCILSLISQTFVRTMDEWLFEWDPGKNRSNVRKHGVDFADAVAVLEDEYGITISDDSASDEERFVSLGMDSKARVVVVVYAYRGENIRIISARVAEPRERAEYEAQI